MTDTRFQGPSVAPTSLFFAGSNPVVPADFAAPYRSAQDHLADELHCSDLLFEALPAVRAWTAAPCAEEPLAALRQCAQRLVELRERIRARGEATPWELPLEVLERRCGLDPVDRQILLLLVAVEVNPRRLFETLEPVVATQSAAPPGLTPALLRQLMLAAGGTRPPWHEWAARFCTESPLLGSGVVLPQNGHGGSVLAATPLGVHPRVLSFLLGLPALDAELKPYVEQVQVPPAAEHFSAEEQRLLAALEPPRTGHCLWLVGPARHGARQLVQRLAGLAHRPVLVLALDAVSRTPPPVQQRLRQALALEQRLTSALTVVPLAGADRPEELALRLDCLNRLGQAAAGPIVVSSETAHPALADLLVGTPCYVLAEPGATARTALWRSELAACGVRLPEEQLARLGEEFVLGPDEVARIARGTVRGAGLASQPHLVAEIRRACLQHKSGRLGRLAQVVETSFGWDDLILPEEALRRLKEIVAYQKQRQRVLLDWNMAAKFPYGTGNTALFSGPPGTGKTMAASVVARAIERELHRVDLSQIVDKYIGETEKNLAIVFRAATDAHAVLLFDEADALFARRTEVSSSHDRYANLETNFLLQCIEQYAGVSILTTNMAEGIDEAFMRRIRFKVEFPFPDAAAREHLWQSSFTPGVPLAGDIRWATLASEFELSGGNIKSVVLRAVFSAASGNRKVSMKDLLQAGYEECKAMGKLVRQTELDELDEPDRKKSTSRKSGRSALRK